MARFIFNSFVADPFELEGIKTERYLESKECVQTIVQSIALLMFCYWNFFIASDGESACPLYIGPRGGVVPTTPAPGPYLVQITPSP